MERTKSTILARVCKEREIDLDSGRMYILARVEAASRGWKLAWQHSEGKLNPLKRKCPVKAAIRACCGKHLNL